MKCKGCKIDQDKNPYKARLYFTNDGYCTVCNHQYKDRPRTKSIFEFRIIKNGSYNHLSKRGRKITEYEGTRDKYGGGTVVGNYNVYQVREARKRKIDEWL